MPRFRREWLAAGALAGVAFLAFSGALDHAFVNFDDTYYVTHNKYVRSGLSLENVRWAFTTYHCSNWHPLTWLSLQLDGQLWAGDDPATFARGFHLTNVLLHAANAALLFLAVRALTGAFWRSTAVALLFAVHPLRVESVAWVAERKDVLSVFFGLLALWAYAAYARAPSPLRYAAVAACLALSLLAKPTLVTLPCLFLVLDWWPLLRAGTVPSPLPGGGTGDRGGAPKTLPAAALSQKGGGDKSERETIPVRPGGRLGSWSRLVAEKLPLFALVAGACVVTVLAQTNIGAVGDLEDYPPGVRLANVVVSYVRYLAKTVWPTALAPFYPYPDGPLPAGEVAGAATALAALTAGAVALRRRAPYLLAGWLWYLGTLVPVIGLVQVGNQAYADRYTYFPQIGVLFAACWGVADLSRGRERLALAAAAAVAVALAARTVQQVGFWQDSYTLWQHTLEVTAPSHTAWMNLGFARDDRGEFEAAARCFQKAAELDPDSYLALTYLGNTLMKLRRPDEAVPRYQVVCKLRPDAPVSFLNLGKAYLRLGKLDLAAEQFEAAGRIAPEVPEASYNLGLVADLREDFSRSAGYYRRALDLRPDYAEAHAGLGIALTHLGQRDEAVEHLRKAVQLDPRLLDRVRSALPKPTQGR